MTSPATIAATLPLKNPKHESVLAAWIADPARVWWKAWRHVYPRSSQHAAETSASRLLKDAEFCARRDQLLGLVAEGVVSDAVMSQLEVLEELSKIGRSDIRNCLVADGDTGEVVSSIGDMKPEHSAAIKELIVETYMDGAGEGAQEVKRVKVKLHSKPGALHELRAHYEPTKHEHTGKDGGAIETRETGEPLDAIDLARRIAFALERGARATPTAAPAKAAKAKPKRGKST